MFVLNSIPGNVLLYYLLMNALNSTVLCNKLLVPPIGHNRNDVA